jgi:hypothetical protein
MNGTEKGANKLKDGSKPQYRVSAGVFATAS